MTGALETGRGGVSTVANQPVAVTGSGGRVRPAQSLLKRVLGLQAFWILGVLIVICLFFTVLAGDRFLSTGNFSLISQNVAVWAVLGVGMTFVIITSGIDLSVGSVLVFSSVVAAKVMEAMGGSGPGVAAAGLVAAVRQRHGMGRHQRRAGRQGQGARADRHPRHALGCARVWRRCSPAASTSARCPTS